MCYNGQYWLAFHYIWEIHVNHRFHNQLCIEKMWNHHNSRDFLAIWINCDELTLEWVILKHIHVSKKNPPRILLERPFYFRPHFFFALLIEILWNWLVSFDMTAGGFGEMWHVVRFDATVCYFLIIVNIFVLFTIITSMKKLDFFTGYSVSWARISRDCGQETRWKLGDKIYNVSENI